MSRAHLLDVGCGRADLFDYLLARKRPPADYIGIEAIPELPAAAREKETAARRSSDVRFCRGIRKACLSAQRLSYFRPLTRLTRRRLHDDPPAYRRVAEVLFSIS